jgi:3',5'-cyclic AMP phosphodiesterase CpdA
MLRRRQVIRGAIGLGAAGLACRREAAPLVLPAPITLSKHPYVQIVGARAARLRFETRIEEAVTVRLARGGETIDVVPTLSSAEVTYERTHIEASDDFYPDYPGLHVVQEIVIDDLDPGEVVGWEVLAHDVANGSFRATPAPDAKVRLGWIADTSWPYSELPASTLAAAAPDVVVHGGDLQYQASPFDSWGGMSQALAPLTSQAPIQMVVGNHEFEDGGEIEQMYDRLYLGQGEGSPATRHFAFSYGGLRIICLDSETGGLAEPGDEQLPWLEAELSAAASSADVAATIVAFHRPVYSLSKHVPGSTTVRDALHPLFLAYGVPLVMCGHAHCYERFEVDGIQYVVDGGGGALLYDPDEGVEEAEMLRPGESALRVASEKSRGVTLIDFEDGALSLTRLDETGTVTEQLAL